MSFEHPDAWHAPATYWFWQRIPTGQEIRDQLDALAAAGFGSFQIQTRLSFPREDYLSDAYLAACREAADEAAARGLMMGLYDEYNWLSGHAGGRTVVGRDELRERHMFFSTSSAAAESTGSWPESAIASGAGSAVPVLVECVVDGIRAKDVDYLLDPGRNWVFEDGRIRWDEWEIVAALAHPGGGIDDAESVVDVTEHAYIAGADAAGCRVRVPADALRGRTAVTVFVAARCASSRMINYLLPEAAERFLEVGYEPYAAALGDHLGSTVTYVFFDQPHACFYGWRQQDDDRADPVGAGDAYRSGAGGEYASGHVLSSLMYAPTIVPADRRVLLSLARDVGPVTAEWRCEFFERYSAVGIDAFFGTLSDWCERHGVALSGHEVLGYVSSWDPTSTIITDDPRPNFGSDYFGLDRWRDLTAVDARNEHPQISAKFGDSVARSHGRSGCLVEQYFARTETGSHFAEGRWELTLGQLRDQTVRHHLLGARQLLTHAFWLTDGGEARRPPGGGNGGASGKEGAHGDDGPERRPDDTPEVFTDPAFDFPPGVNFEPWFAHHRAFADESGRLSEFLDEAQPLDEIALLYPLRTSWAGGPAHSYGAHLAFWAEHLARGGYDFGIVDERDLRNGRLAGGYRTLILPGVSVVADLSTVEGVEEFAAAGGTVLASGPLPTATQSGAGGGQGGRGAPAGQEGRVAEHRIRAVLEGPRGAYWADVPAGEDVDAHLTATLAGHPQVESDGDVWSVRREDADGTRIAIFNDDPGRRVVTVRPSRVPASVTRWDLRNGRRDEPFEVAGAVTLTLEAGEVACLHVGVGGAVAADRVRDVPGTRVLDQGWTLRAAGLEPRPVDVYRGWELQGLSDFSGIGEYRTEFELGAGATGARAGWPEWELELPDVRASAEAEVNGVVVGRWGWGPFRCVFPADVLRAGSNELRITVASTAANRYYAGAAEASGLVRPPRLRPKL
jgi:hypothetical protein